MQRWISRFSLFAVPYLEQRIFKVQSQRPTTRRRKEADNNNYDVEEEETVRVEEQNEIRMRGVFTSKRIPRGEVVAAIPVTKYSCGNVLDGAASFSVLSKCTLQQLPNFECSAKGDENEKMDLSLSKAASKEEEEENINRESLDAATMARTADTESSRKFKEILQKISQQRQHHKYRRSAKPNIAHFVSQLAKQTKVVAKEAEDTLGTKKANRNSQLNNSGMHYSPSASFLPFTTRDALLICTVLALFRVVERSGGSLSSSSSRSPSQRTTESPAAVKAKLERLFGEDDGSEDLTSFKEEGGSKLQSSSLPLEIEKMLEKLYHWITSFPASVPAIGLALQQELENLEGNTSIACERRRTMLSSISDEGPHGRGSHETILKRDGTPIPAAEEEKRRKDATGDVLFNAEIETEKSMLREVAKMEALLQSEVFQPLAVCLSEFLQSKLRRKSLEETGDVNVGKEEEGEEASLTQSQRNLLNDGYSYSNCLEAVNWAYFMLRSRTVNGAFQQGSYKRIAAAAGDGRRGKEVSWRRADAASNLAEVSAMEWVNEQYVAIIPVLDMLNHDAVRANISFSCYQLNDFVVEQWLRKVIKQQQRNIGMMPSLQQQQQQASTSGIAACTQNFFHEMKEAQEEHLFDSTAKRQVPHRRSSSPSISAAQDPRLQRVYLITASRDIEPGEELLMDYGNFEERALFLLPYADRIKERQLRCEEVATTKGSRNSMLQGTFSPTSMGAVVEKNGREEPDFQSLTYHMSDTWFSWAFGFPKSEEEKDYQTTSLWNKRLVDRIAKMTNVRRKGRPGEFVVGVPEGLRHLKEMRQRLARTSSTTRKLPVAR